MRKENHKKALKHNVFNILSTVSKETGIRSYVVGGFVRDYFLNIKNCDIDIVVEGSGIDFATYFSNKVNGKLTYFENYGTANVKFDDIEIEFVGARKEMYERGSRKPIVEEGTLYDDISRRDFTINAMAISLNEDNYGDLIDYFNGYEDLLLKIIKTPLNPDITFSDDPLRMFRAVRFISKLKGFKINNKIKESIINNANRCSILSRERITSEIEKMLLYKEPKEGLLLLNELDLWKYAFPNNSFDVTNVNCVNSTDDIDIRWFFIASKYNGNHYNFICDMKLSKEICNKLDSIKFTFDNFNDMSFPSLYKVRKSLYKSGRLSFKGLNAAMIFLFNTKEETNLTINDILEWHDYTVNIFYENLEFIDYKLPCNGNEISYYSSIQEGKNLGNFINYIKEEIFKGNVKNTRNGVIALSRHSKIMKNFNN